MIASEIVGTEDVSLPIDAEMVDIDNDVSTLSVICTNITLNGQLCLSGGFNSTVCVTPLTVFPTGPIQPHLVYLPLDNENEVVGTVSMKTIDPEGLESGGSVTTIRLSAVNDPPTVPNVTVVNVIEDIMTDFTLEGFDVEDDLFSWTVVSLPDKGTLYQGKLHKRYHICVGSIVISSINGQFNGLCCYSCSDNGSDSGPEHCCGVVWRIS